MEYAINFIGNRQAELAEHPRPVQCEAGYVMGQTLCSLISPGTELSSGFTSESDLVSIPGYAAVFRIDQVGENVTTLKTGDVVMSMGPHQSWQHILESQAIKLPEGITADLAVLSRLMNVSMTTLMTTQARPGELVLITGAGPVGFLAAHLFKRCGYEVIVCEPDPDRREMVKASGIAHVFATPPIDDPEWKGRVALVLECSGHESAALNGCRIVRRKGEVVLVGVPWKRNTESYAHELLSLIFHQYAIVRSGWEWEIPLHSDLFQPQGIFDNIHKGMRWLAEGLLDTTQLMRKVSPWQANEIYNDLADRKVKEQFVILDWQTR